MSPEVENKPRYGTVDQEVWRMSVLPDVLVSSHGRLMRLPYQAPLPNGGLRWYGGLPSVGAWQGEKERRYIYIYQGRSYRVARLVCEAFHGPPPPGKNICMHSDENSRNNRADNLKWGTQKENLNAPGFLAYCNSPDHHLRQYDGRHEGLDH